MKAFKGRFLSSKKNMEFIQISKVEHQNLEVRSIKRLNIARGKLASVALSITDPSSTVLGKQCSVVSIDENLEVQNKVVTIGNKGGFSVSVKNTGTIPARLPAGGLWGYANIIPDIELELPVSRSDEEIISSEKQNDDDSGPDDIDKYLNSSEDEEEMEDEKEATVKITRSSFNCQSVQPANCKSENLNTKAKVTFCEPKEVITSLDDYKKRINIFDQDSCITGTSTPEIIKTSATNELMTELKESLDKSFDAVRDFLIDTDVDSIEEEISLHVDKIEIQNETGVSEPKWVHNAYKSISDFKEKQLSSFCPLLPQLKGLAKLLEPISIFENLDEHFPGLFGQDHLAPVCKTLVKYVKFHESSISFDLSDFGDKLVCELSTIAQTDLHTLKASIEEMNSKDPNATIQEWIQMFADTFENFQNINDLLGDEFDMKAVQIVLLHFVPELSIENINSEDPLTVLNAFSEVMAPVIETQKSGIPTSLAFRQDEDITEEKILEFFDINKLREKIFIGVKSGSDDKIMIIDNDRPVFFKLQNTFQQSLLSHVDDDDIYLICVSDLLSPQCELAVSLSSWNVGTSRLFKTGFILYQLSSSEYKVALVEGEELSTLSVDRSEIKMLDDSEQKVLLKPGTEVKLIMKSSMKVLMGLINPDGNYWDLLETTSLKINSNEIENFVKKSVTFKIVSFENNRKFLLMTSSSRKTIFDAQRAVLKTSPIQQQQRSRKYSVTLAATFQTSKRELFKLRHVLNLSGANIKLVRNLIKVEGDNEERVQNASKIIAFNISKNRKNVINSSRDFREFSMGKNIAIKQNETQQLELQLRAGVSMQEYDAHVHFDFKCFSENIKPTIKQTSDKCIKLQLCNVSQNTIEIPAEQNIILLARKDIDKSSPLA